MGAVAAVEVEGVSKSFGGTRALGDASLRVREGRIFCLLGPNGAGKTTLVKGLLSLLRFDSGRARIHGVDTREPSSRSRAAYLPERFSFYPWYTVDGFLDFSCALHGVPAGERGARKGEALERMGVADQERAKMGRLSKGQLQRVALAAVLASGKDLLVLDEPFSGMDPIGVRHFKEAVVERARAGAAVLVNTHLLGEAGPICDDLAIISRGETIAHGAKDDLVRDASLETFFHEKVAAHGA